MMDTPGTRFEDMGRRVDECLGSAIPRIEEEIKRVISYLNDEVVPHVRQDSAQARRSAAAQSGKLADRLDASRAGRKLGVNGRTNWLRWLGLSIVIALNTGCRHKTQTIAVPPPPPPPSQSSPSNTGVIANSNRNSNERPVPSVPVAPKGPGVVADSPADADFIRTHTPIYSEEGLASWYGPPYHKRRGANGEIYDQNALTAAHRTLPLNSLIKVTNLATGHSVIIRVTDRGPFVPDRILDLSLASAKAIDVWRSGVARVRIDVYAAPLKKVSRGTP